jgi:putative endonuclease
VEGFTKKYGCDKLVWYEQHDTMESAIIREKRIKDWKRRWKVQLIEQKNPGWLDLYDSLFWSADYKPQSGFRLSPE